MNLYIFGFDSEYRHCEIATGTNAYRDGPERTVALIEFKGTREQREAGFKALRAALKDAPELYEAMGLEPVKFPEVQCKR